MTLIRFFLVFLSFLPHCLRAHTLLTLSIGDDLIVKVPYQQFQVNYSTYNFSSITGLPSTFVYGIFLGREWDAPKNTLIQLGTSYYQPLRLHIRGNLSQGVDPESYDYYRYQYAVQSYQWYLESKWLKRFEQNIYPYLSFALGAAWNRASAYEATTAAPPFTAFTPVFSSANTTTFVYMLGLGVEANIKASWRLGLGYRYGQWGNVLLGPATINTTKTGNYLSYRLNDQKIVFQLTYIT